MIYSLRIPQAEAKYLELHLDHRLNWRKHIFTKRKQLGLQLGKWLLGKSQPSIENRLLLYGTILKFIWACGVQLYSYQYRNITNISNTSELLSMLHGMSPMILYIIILT